MSDGPQQIDVRKIPPPKKHSTIFETYDDLAPGESFIIINDHDPKPLKYQMASVRGKDAFGWVYLEQGPDIWKVHISKLATE